MILNDMFKANDRWLHMGALEYAKVICGFQHRSLCFLLYILQYLWNLQYPRAYIHVDDISIFEKVIYKVISVTVKPVI